MTRSYEAASTFAQTSAVTAAASSTAALPVSVRRKLRSGVSRLRTQAVRPEKGDSPADGLVSTSLAVNGRHAAILAPPAGAAAASRSGPSELYHETIAATLLAY